MVSLKKLKRYAIIAGISVFGILLILFLFRQTIFLHFLESKIESFNKNHPGIISYKNAELSGLSEISLTGICLTPLNNDTLLKIDSLNTEIHIWPLLSGDIVIASLFINHLTLNIDNKDSTDNFSFLFKKRITSETDTLQNKEKVDYHKRSELIFNALFNHIPEQLSLSEWKIIYKHHADSVEAFSQSLELRENVLKSVIHLNDGKNNSDIQLAGKIIPDERIASFKIVQAGKKNKIIAGLVNPLNAKASFDTAYFSFIQSNTSTNYNELIGKTYIKNVKINQPSISKTEVFFGELKFDFDIRIGENYFQLDSTSTAYFNKLTFHPFINFTVYPQKQITLKIQKPSFAADELFSSLPEGLFHTLYGIKTSGNLSYNLNFFVDLSQPDSLTFFSELKREKFHIERFGKVNYTLLDSNFVYTAFEKEEPVRSFVVGPSNPGFTPLNQISPYLRNAILCTEDGGFFTHRGFIPEAFQQSIVQNIKQKRFARGGSTITMQLVKNVFLKRNKTIARKLEEILIVWLIENQGLCSKERMYEVYLNIIEWGPNIYGVTEASRFYFNKKPSELTLQESIYLASIIPKPKYFKYSFEANGILKNDVKDFILAIANKMIKKEMINPSELENFNPDISLSGEAKTLISPTDSIPPNLDLELKIP